MRSVPAAPRLGMTFGVGNPRSVAGWCIALAVWTLAGCTSPAPESSQPTPDGNSRGELAGVGEAAPTRQLDAAFVLHLDQQVEAELDRLGVPGAAMVLVEGERLVHSRGFGIRQVGRPAPVTERTVFRVVDLTQAMTTTMVATLVDENRLEWDTSALDLGIALADPVIATEIRLQDLLSMTSGLGGQTTDQRTTRAFGRGNPSLATLEAASQQLAGVGPIGSHWPQSSLFATTSYRSAVASRALEGDGPRATYHRLMQERVFGPTGMTRTVVGVRLAAVAEDVATPHAPALAGGLVAVDPEEVGALAPADGVASTAEDLGRFLVLHLRGGIAASGQRVASAENLARTHTAFAQVDADTAAWWPSSLACSAALGWTRCQPLDRQHEEPGTATMLGHLGGIDGFSAAMVVLPDHDLGLAVVANLDPRFGGLEFVAAVRDAFLERALGHPLATPEAVAERAGWRRQLDRLATSTRAVSAGEARRVIGTYEDGWSLAMNDRQLELRRALQAYPLRAVAAGHFVVAEGPQIGADVRIERGPGGLGLVLSDTAGEAVARVAKLY